MKRPEAEAVLTEAQRGSGERSYCAREKQQICDAAGGGGENRMYGN